MRLHKTIYGKLQEWDFLPTYVLAFIAIAGFVWSIKSSKDVTEALKAVNFPIVQYSDFVWINDGEQFSSENPPAGIISSIKNTSNVPIKIHDIDWELFFGREELDDLKLDYGPSGGLILAPEDDTQLKSHKKESFQKYLGKSKPDRFTPPHLNMDLRIKYSMLGGAEQYIYSTKRDFHFKPSQPGLKTSERTRENIKPL